jgi:hypothetical protein
MIHLRPHPTEVDNKIIIALKYNIAKLTNAYTYAFNKKDYADFDTFNITGQPSVDHSNVGDKLRTSKKPVVFFMCYDVGPNKILGEFIRHIVCCIAYPSKKETRILFFDMRNLADISKHHKKFLEKEIEKVCGCAPVKLINLGNSTYLQRFKGENEMGWCIAWSLFFLNATVTQKFDISRETELKNFYKLIDSQLKKTNSNALIEEWFLAAIEV